MQSGRELIESIARRVSLRAGIPASAPVAVQALAADLGIPVHEGAIEEAGRLLLQDGAPRILLNYGEPQERRRFTLAHELAHWLLRAETHESDCAGARSAYDSEEYLCDKIAGAILMPEAWIVGFRRHPHTLATVRAVGGQAQVSLSAALVRLRDVLGWRTTLYQWVREGDGWTFDGEAGLFPAQQGLLRTTEGTRMELRRVAALEQSISEEGLPVLLGYDDANVPGEVSVSRQAQRAVALLHLPDPGRGAAGADQRLVWRRTRKAPTGAWTHEQRLRRDGLLVGLR